MFSWFRESRRAELLAQPYPQAWESWLLANVAHYRLLDEEEKARLRNDTRIFVAEKYWEGCRGLIVTDEMKVTIAGQACLMLLGREHNYFPRVLTVLVYPSTFTRTSDAWPEVEDRKEAIDGLAAQHGPVILAWDRVLAEGRDPSSGENPLESPELARRWHTLMMDEYKRLVGKVRNNQVTFLGDYAAWSEAEFFAVASERFFTLPGRLRHYHPALYELLAEFYCVEPLQWFARSESAAG
jgi:Mlc titration factor MtfA (ptsG expression regulator)